MFDWGKNKKHVEAFLQTFDEIQTSASEERLKEMVAELDPVFESEEEDALALPPPTAKDNLKGFLSLFVPREGYFITPILIDINILIFIIMVMSGVGILLPDGEDVLKWGANFRASTLGGEWWRLLTNIFLHFGILHLLLNMYALMYIGVLLEPYLGKAKFLTAYLFAGIIASLTSIYWHPFTISAGASGAIFGMYGVFLAMLTTNFISREARKPLLISIGVFVVFNLANGVKAGIDNAAHIGGLLSGFIIGYAYYPSLKKPLQAGLNYLTLGVLTLSFVIASIVVYKQIPDDIVKYDKKMAAFSRYEESALEVFKYPENTPKEELLKMVDAGLNDWNKSLVVLSEASKLDVPTEVLVRNNQLQQYCQLRIMSFGFIRKGISENTEAYADSVKVYNEKIETLLNDLKGIQK
ncbi:rhomboid family intramembrane serine protease [Mucilaginibacter sp. UYCu711]|uniref:rhomboid family intramembrane serine protease n=1 Tax=Mucilaginibacter sp. UYCu711 TaxID=3156339 RepID=UPI003D192333